MFLFCMYIIPLFNGNKININIRLKQKTNYNTSRIYNITCTCNTVSTKLLNVCLDIDPSILSSIVKSQPPIVVPAQTLK